MEMKPVNELIAKITDMATSIFPPMFEDGFITPPPFHPCIITLPTYLAEAYGTHKGISLVEDNSWMTKSADFWLYEHSPAKGEGFPQCLFSEQECAKLGMQRSAKQHALRPHKLYAQEAQDGGCY